MFDNTYQELGSRIQDVARRDGDIFIATKEPLLTIALY